MMFRNLVEKRKALGLTIQEVANRLPTNRVVVSRWESGARTPSIDQYLRWARVVGKRVFLVPAEDAFTNDGRVAYAEIREVPDLGAALRARREYSGLSLRRLALDTGMNDKRIGSFEHGEGRSRLVTRFSDWTAALGTELVAVDDGSPLTKEWDR